MVYDLRYTDLDNFEDKIKLIRAVKLEKPKTLILISDMRAWSLTNLKAIENPEEEEAAPEDDEEEQGP